MSNDWITKNARYHTGIGFKRHCSVCEQKKPKAQVTLCPLRCLNRNADPTTIPHRICDDCWFGNNGFGTEGGNHPCPGCQKEIPLQRIKRSRRQIRNRIPEDAEVIELSDDDD